MNLNSSFVKYKDLLTINEFDENTNSEEFVFLPKKGNSVIGKYYGILNMTNYGDKIPVRKTIYKKRRFG
jgi:hypothetical protein